jgi:hypothetical protein
MAKRRALNSVKTTTPKTSTRPQTREPHFPYSIRRPIIRTDSKPELVTCEVDETTAENV